MTLGDTMSAPSPRRSPRSSFRNSTRSQPPCDSPDPGHSLPSSSRLYTLIHTTPRQTPRPPTEGEVTARARREREATLQTAYQDRCDYWETRWQALNERLMQRLQTQATEVTTEQALERSQSEAAGSFWTNHNEQKSWKAIRGRYWEEEVGERTKECQALKHEALKQSIKDDYNIGQLQSHLTQVLTLLVEQNEIDYQQHEFDLRHSLRQTERRMLDEQHRAAFASQEALRAETERARLEEEKYRSGEGARRKQAMQMKVLQRSQTARRRA